MCPHERWYERMRPRGHSILAWRQARMKAKGPDRQNETNRTLRWENESLEFIALVGGKRVQQQDTHESCPLSQHMHSSQEIQTGILTKGS